MKKNLNKSILVCGLLLAAITGHTQSDTTDGNYESLSLKDLLNVKIVSVSKKQEFLFDAALSASVVTKEEIQRTGCTSIMEALRLVPGMIVREQTNGNYDIRLRGMDNTPDAEFEGGSTTTLVMIDNRPIYNYLKGGTFWETLPVDLNDVEKIEVVRGPAAALYGPNAVSGVINIITRQTKKDGVSIVANNRQGSYHSFINNATVGYQTGKWKMMASGNYQSRQRAQTSYYEIYRNQWIDNPPYLLNYLGDMASNIKQRYPDQSLALKKYAGNLGVAFNPTEEMKFSVNAGAQHSVAQKVSTDNGFTPISTVASDTKYADFKASLKGVTAQVSYNKGIQQIDYNPGSKYAFNTFDAGIEYNYTKNNFSLKPGVSYRSAVYDDTKYSDTVNKTGIFNARGRIITQSASLRGEYKMLENKLRLVAGAVLNKFNYPDTTYISYQFASTYKINSKHLVRAVYSRAPRSSNVQETFINQTVAFYQSGIHKYTRLMVIGNKNKKLLTADMMEIGYRGSITKKAYVDVELFDISTKNYSMLISSRIYSYMAGADTIVVSPIYPTAIPLTVHQRGVTVSLAWSSGKFQLKPFVTFQRSRMRNYSPYHNTPDAPYSNASKRNIYSGVGTVSTEKGTPTVFGGLIANWEPCSKLNLNLNTYYSSSQTYYHLSNVLFHDGVRGVDHIDGKLIVNASVSYEALKGLHIVCTGKNVLNDRSREFFRTDDVPFMLMTGVSFEF